MGRVGLGIKPKNPSTLYALVTAQKGQGGFFRSDDAGASWTRIGRQVSEGRGGFGGGQFGGDPNAPPPTPPAPCGPIGAPVSGPAPAPGGRGAPGDSFHGGDPG